MNNPLGASLQTHINHPPCEQTTHFAQKFRRINELMWQVWQ